MHHKYNAIAIVFVLLALMIVLPAHGLLPEQLQQQKDQALIDALVHYDGGKALALVNEGADPNTPYTPIPVLSQPERVKQVHRSPSTVNDNPTAFLIACGAVVSTGEGITGIMIYESDNSQLIQAMLKHGANVNARSSSSNSSNGGRTALMWASIYGKQNTVGVLLEHGADVNAKDNSGFTVLMEAVFDYPSPDVVRLLLEHGADVNAKTKSGMTALILEVWLHDDRYVDVARLLLEHGAAVNVKDNIRYGWTPLMCAAMQDASQEVHLLLEHGADVNAKTNKRLTPLMYAAKFASPDVVHLLLDHGADVNAKDKFGDTPLTLAQGRPDIIALLRKYGAK